MNWLAHIFVSDNAIDYQLGNLLADPLKGRSWQGASRQLENGLEMHGRIDAFTDANPFFRKSKSRLGNKGHLKAVIVDIAYDHCLIRNWNRYSNIELDCFINTFHERAGAAIEHYPANASRFVQRLIDYGVLTSYGSFNGLETAFQRIDSRLSRRMLARESAVEYLPALKKEIGAIEQDFLHFFPLLLEYFRSQVQTPLNNHWLK